MITTTTIIVLLAILMPLKSETLACLLNPSWNNGHQILTDYLLEIGHICMRLTHFYRFNQSYHFALLFFIIYVI